MGTEPSHRRRRRLWLILVQMAVLLAVGLFFGRALLRNWEEVRAASFQYNGLLLTLSALLLSTFFLALILAWRQMLRWMGHSLGLGPGARVWFISQLGKYVPGKVLTAVSRVYLAVQEGVSLSAALLSFYLELVLLLLSGLFLYLLTWPASAGTGSYAWASLVAVPLGLVIVYPPLIERLLNWLLRRLGKEPISLRLKYSQVLLLLILYLASWCVYGLSQYCLIAALYPIDKQLLLPVLGISSLAWGAGFLSFVAPGGLGIREGVQGVLLARILPIAVATIAPVLARLLWTLVEALGVVSAAGGEALRRRRLRQREESGGNEGRS